MEEQAKPACTMGHTDCIHPPWCLAGRRCALKEGLVERFPDPGQQWKLGDEFLPFHPQASHIEPAYRDGWNRCYWMAITKRNGT